MTMLTKRQAEAHRFIFEFSRHNGRSPTCQEIATGLNLKARSNAHRHCRQLEDRGILHREQSTSWRYDPERTLVLHETPPLHNVAVFKAVYDNIEQHQELVPLEEAV